MSGNLGGRSDRKGEKLQEERREKARKSCKLDRENERKIAGKGCRLLKKAKQEGFSTVRTKRDLGLEEDNRIIIAFPLSVC